MHPVARTSSERGAVVVMVAVWLPILALFAGFAIDIAHFFDYSRNLQNRADAAALAAGVAYGGTCFGSGYTTAQTDVIGQAAQQYSGPPATSGNPYTVPNNLPYPYTTFTPSQYKNAPNLTKGTPPNYHVLLNSTANWGQPGAADWNMESSAAQATDPSPPSSLALCSSTDESGQTGPMADVRVTQSQLGLFFPLPGVVSPTISAHARVTLEGVGSENNLIPLAVRDPAEERCVEAIFFNATTGNQIGTPVPLKRIGQDPNTGAIQWDNTATPAAVSIPSGANVYTQIVTGYCGANPQTYDQGSGLLYINSWSTTPLPLGSGAKPVITQGGVTLTGTACHTADARSNQYFTNVTCNVGLTANVAFDPSAGTTTVSATDTNTNQTVQLTNTGGNTWSTPANQGFTIDAGSGQNAFDITTSQSSGNPCNGRGNKVGVCDLGIQTQSFGACNDGDPNLTCANPPNDSGPIVLAQLRLASDTEPPNTWASDTAQIYGRNSFAGDPTNPQSLIVTVEISGLNNAKPGDPPTTLRFTESGNNTDHATGLINCGQGPSNTGGISALMQGCPVAGTAACPVGSTYFSSCAPLAINERPASVADPCNPEGNDLSGTIVARGSDPSVPVDCTGTAAGNMPPVIQGLACRIYLAGCTKNGKANGTVCAPNNWSPSEGIASPANDPRAITVVITAPADLASNNSKQTIPIQNFAVFYVTGWSSNSATACSGYGPLPAGAAGDAETVNNCPDGKLPSQEPGGTCLGVKRGMIWGFWMKYTDPNANPSGKPCNVVAFGNCTPALTR